VRSRSSFRFDPPRVEITAAVSWPLRRAFGPVAAEAGEPEAGAALEWSRALGLSARVGARNDLTVLSRELGAGPARELADDAALATARWLVRGQSLRLLAAAARSCGVAPILLKGAALLATGIAQPGARDLSDIDVLVPAEATRALTAALVDRGFVPAGFRDAGHHLRPLRHPSFKSIELHHYLPGLLAGSGRPIRYRDLAGSCSTSPLLDGVAGLAVPDSSFLAAAAIEHAIGQHGLAPSAYPLLRMIGDVIDLARTSGLNALMSAASVWGGGGASGREYEAVRELALGLAAGDLPDESSDAMAIVRHCVAARTDAEYSSTLRRRNAAAILKRGDWRKVAAALRRRLTPRARWPARGVSNVPSGR
jgi:hypothetical protein